MHALTRRRNQYNIQCTKTTYNIFLIPRCFLADKYKVPGIEMEELLISSTFLFFCNNDAHAIPTRSICDAIKSNKLRMPSCYAIKTN